MHNLAFGSVWLLVFVIPWENFFLIPGIGTLGRVFGLLALVAGVAVVLCHGEEIRLHRFHWLLFFFFLMAGFSYFWSIDQELTLIRLKTYLQLFVMVWLVYQWVTEIKALNALLGAYVLGAYVSVFSTIANYLQGDMVNWQRYAAQGFNPNDLAIILALGIPIAWYLSRSGAGGRIRWVYTLYPFIAPISIALTGSRNGLIAMLVALSFVVFSFHKLTFTYKLIFLFVGAAAIYYGFLFIPPESLDRWGTTGSELAGGSLNERIYIWKAGLNAFFQAPLWGIGAGAFSAAVEPFFGQGKSPHNVYLAILVEQGLVGFAPFALILFTALYSVMKMPKSERNFWLVLLATWGISAFVLNWEWRKQTWLLLGFVAAHVELLRKQPKNESSNIKMKMIYKPWRF